ESTGIGCNASDFEVEYWLPDIALAVYILFVARTPESKPYLFLQI
ncbi:7494_t:CDS:2, partial [Dentiscutata erythropus]